MEFSEDFVLPTIEVTNKPVPETQASDDAFYAAGSYSNDPINDYTMIHHYLENKKETSYLHTLSQDISLLISKISMFKEPHQLQWEIPI